MDNSDFEKIHDFIMSQVVRRKFGNSNLRKRPNHYYLVAVFFCSNNTGVLRQKNHWQFERISEVHSIEKIQISWVRNSFSLIVIVIFLHLSISLFSCFFSTNKFKVFVPVFSSVSTTITAVVCDFCGYCVTRTFDRIFQ